MSRQRLEVVMILPVQWLYTIQAWAITASSYPFLHVGYLE
jgi:hypothetical protein